MASEFFQNFPLISYKTDTINESVEVVDMFRRVALNQSFKNSSDFFIEYTIKETDTPHIIANKLYNNPEYYWIVMMANDLADINYDWFLPQRSLENYINKKHQGQVLLLWNVNGAFKIGETISINGKSAIVKKWDSTYHRLIITIPDKSFLVGDIIIGGTTNATATVKRIMLDAASSIHHFSLNAVVNGEYLDPWDSNNYLSGYINSSIDIHVITQRDVDIHENDLRKTIKIIRPEFVSNVEKQLENLLNLTIFNRSVGNSPIT